MSSISDEAITFLENQMNKYGIVNICCGSRISLRVRGLTRIKLHSEYQSLGGSSTPLIIG